MGSRSNDAKQALRIFFRNPGFAAVTVVVLAGYLPARRAMRLDRMAALRQE
jgi:ABC-type lipoprotein release transport system permease subunit